MIPLEQFHPIAIHFPIVLVIAAVAFDFFILVKGGDLNARKCLSNMAVGIWAAAGLAAATAYFFGDAALDIAIERGVPDRLLETHEDLGTITAIVIASLAAARLFLWWRRYPLSDRRGWLTCVLGLGALGLIITTAYFGGQLVYEHGVNVILTKP